MLIGGIGSGYIGMGAGGGYTITSIGSTPLWLWLQVISLGILTIWARGMGPRFRPDQLTEIVWRDMLIYLGGLLILVLFYVLAG